MLTVFTKVLLLLKCKKKAVLTSNNIKFKSSSGFFTKLSSITTMFFYLVECIFQQINKHFSYNKKVRF